MESKRSLKLFYFYVCRPITLLSNGGKRYIITFIDDYSLKIWVYFLQEKSKAFEVFKRYKALVDNEVNKPTKVI